MVSGGMSCVKYLLVFFNLLFLISGKIIIVFGVAALYSLNAKFAAVPILLIAVGTLTVIVAFFGCYGSFRENYCMVVTFSVLQLTILCIEWAIGICGYVYFNVTENLFEESMVKYNVSQEIQESWNELQRDLRCCGTNGPEDWQVHGMCIPVSCCEDASFDGVCLLGNAYEEGCAIPLKDEINDFALVIGGVAFGIVFVQFVGVIFACCLARSIRKEDKRCRGHIYSNTSDLKQESLYYEPALKLQCN